MNCLIVPMDLITTRLRIFRTEHKIRYKNKRRQRYYEHIFGTSVISAVFYFLSTAVSKLFTYLVMTIGPVIFFLRQHVYNERTEWKL